MRCSIAILLLAAPLAFGADPAPQPKAAAVKLTADPPKPVPCQPCIVDCDSKTPVLWRVKGEAAYKVRGNAMFLTIPTGDPVTVFAYTVAGDQVVETILVLAPDKPPEPPKPVDPLVRRIKDLLATEAGSLPDKVKWLLALAALYGEAVNFATNPAVLTTSDLAGRVIEAAKLMVPVGALPGVRAVIADVLSAAFPEDVTLTDGTRRAAAETFAKLAAALKEAAK